MPKLKLQFARPDFILLAVVLLLITLGLVAIYDASVVQALRDFGDKYYFLKLQLIWLMVGLAALTFFAWFDYNKLAVIAPFLLLAALILLTLVLIPGVATEVYGAKRRLDFGPLTVQPAEFAKFAYVVYLSNLLARGASRFSVGLLPFLVVTLPVAGLIFLEPDLGTALIVLTIGMVLYFSAGAPLKYFFLLVPAAGVIVSILAVSAPYRLNRILAFINPLADPQGSSYHINQILIALANGGLTGLGLGQSRQKYEYIPEVATDSIFAIIAEEAGLIGSLAVVGLFLFLVYRAFKVAKLAPDRFGELLALGIIAWIGTQSLVNLAGMVALLPLTGVPLPFVSYGGSALITNLAAIGVLLNISRQRIAMPRK